MTVVTLKQYYRNGIQAWNVLDWLKTAVHSAIIITVSLSFMRCWSYIFDRLDGFVQISNL